LNDSEIAWQFVRLRRLLSDASVITAGAEQRLGTVDINALRVGSRMALTADECNDTLDAIVALHDLADVMEQIVGAMQPQHGTLVVSADEIAAQAMLTLESASSDSSLVTLAARLLPRTAGFRGLAAAIEADPDAVAGWAGLTIGELLASFTGTHEAHIERVTETAEIDPSATWDTLTHTALARLAQALREGSDG
jgi:predicted LPLAT superfamily acyltransferase